MPRAPMELLSFNQLNWIYRALSGSLHHISRVRKLFLLKAFTVLAPGSINTRSKFRFRAAEEETKAGGAKACFNPLAYPGPWVRRRKWGRRKEKLLQGVMEEQKKVRCLLHHSLPIPFQTKIDTNHPLPSLPGFIVLTLAPSKFQVFMLFNW